MIQKAVWLTNIDSDVMNSRKNLAEGLQRLSDLGFNTIYPVVWQRGYTLYPSEVSKQLSGAAILPNSPFVGRDVLAEILELAQPLKIRTIPWFEYGLMVPPKSTIALKYKELLTLDINETAQRTQGANGELGFYIISHGGRSPYRLHFRRPCFIYYQAYPEMIKGSTISDAILTMSSLNVIAGELDA